MKIGRGKKKKALFVFPKFKEPTKESLEINRRARISSYYVDALKEKI